MDVVRAGELHAAPDGVDQTASFDERRRNRKTEEREPCDSHEVDPREIVEEPRQADRQEREEPCSQRYEHVTTPPDGPHQRHRTAVGGGKDERADRHIEDRPSGPLQLPVRHAENRRPDAESE